MVSRLSSEAVYITMLGRSSWAVVNSFYAVVQQWGYRPKRVYLFTEAIYRERLSRVERGISIIARGYGFSPTIESVVVADADFIDSGRKISSLIRKLKEEGAEVAIDITPGRKAMVAGALMPLMEIDVDHIFYLAIRAIRFGDRPYRMIPSQVYTLHNFVREAWTV